MGEVSCLQLTFQSSFCLRCEREAGYPKVLHYAFQRRIINFSVLLPSGEFSALCRNTKKLENTACQGNEIRTSAGNGIGILIRRPPNCGFVNGGVVALNSISSGSLLMRIEDLPPASHHGPRSQMFCLANFLNISKLDRLFGSPSLPTPQLPFPDECKPRSDPRRFEFVLLSICCFHSCQEILSKVIPTFNIL